VLRTRPSSPVVTAATWPGSLPEALGAAWSWSLVTGGMKVVVLTVVIGRKVGDLIVVVGRKVVVVVDVEVDVLVVAVVAVV
jgi:hypothetical protein